MALRKVYTKGIRNANKQFIMAAIAYNLKKYLKFESKSTQTTSGELNQAILSPNKLINLLCSSILGLLSIDIGFSDKNNFKLNLMVQKINLKIYYSA